MIASLFFGAAMLLVWAVFVEKYPHDSWRAGYDVACDIYAVIFIITVTYLLWKYLP